MNQQQYFSWDDDVAIPFTLVNDRRRVTGTALLQMVHAALWHAQSGDFSPKQTIETTVELTGCYQPLSDEAILPAWVNDLDECDEDGNDLDPATRYCDCGHAINAHQTGDGPWTGFCYALPKDGQLTGESCQCERPTIDGKEVK